MKQIHDVVPFPIAEFGRSECLRKPLKTIATQPAYFTGRRHYCILRIQTTNDRLGVYCDMPQEMVIYEPSHVRILHHQILECVANITYHLV
jgi:hypothetical protein